ncbi:MAG TPA: hypothetical protein EYP53_00380 [Candidatus Latescibacteria bacterium]|nr:hypothetical protein [Candidatus Latescibacterota bacterium]
MLDFLKNAFAVESGKGIDGLQGVDLQRQKELVGRLARAIVQRRLTAPAIFFLESVKPMNFLGNQVMIFFEPIVRSLFSFAEYSEFAALLQDRDCLEKLISEIERLERSETG